MNNDGNQTQPGHEVQVVTMDELFGGGILTEVEVPEIQRNGRPVSLYLRQLSAKEAMDFTELPKEKREEREVQFRFLALGVVNEKGERLITAGNEHRIADMPAGAFNRVFRKYTEILGLVRTRGEDGKPTSDPTEVTEEGKG